MLPISRYRVWRRESCLAISVAVASASATLRPGRYRPTSACRRCRRSRDCASDRVPAMAGLIDESNRAVAAAPVNSRPLKWLTDRSVRAGGVLLIIAQLIWKAGDVRHLYFYQDDYV